ncbi:response regulator [Paenibacillus arenilitoris]|uniref:Response regulator n=1 Tax=Paenibacillus arenilitoris TaxID=2772299 RepID=A0A927CJQ3_9BACL|nr:response regulator [Paenibacillus arenilitoris]MBD2867146.1 response regulator [Paenibacillus arenilitoris]
MLSFGIVDDDAASIRMLQSIIEKSWLGEVVMTAENGSEGEKAVLGSNPDVLLIDLLMPDQDGIETIRHLKEQGYGGKYVMISQIEHKEMIGRAYQAGIEFYIRKPINRIEVEAVLTKVKEHWNIGRYLNEIKNVMTKLGGVNDRLGNAHRRATVKEIVQPILRDMGIVGESGSGDMIKIMEHLVLHNREDSLPPLKQLYEAAARSHRDPCKEAKAVEQRIRRAVMNAASNLASLGAADFGNPKFEHYAPIYFDFHDIRLKMKEIDGQPQPGGGKANIKKFLQVLYLEVLDKRRGMFD